jgi:hypothetical protein
LHIALEIGFSASWFSEHRAANVASDFVNSVTEYELFIATFWTFNTQKTAAWFWDEFVPFAHLIFLLIIIL